VEILFLGTSSGVPTKQRNVSAIAIKRIDSKRWYLVDCGEATQHQILRSKLSINKLAAIFITHVHGDHCFGLAGLLASAAMGGRSESLTIVAPVAIQELLSTLITTTQMRLGYEINFIALESVQSALLYSDFAVTVHPLSHRVPSYGYKFRETNVEPSLDQDKLKSDGIAPGPIWGRIQKGENIRLDTGEVINAAEYLISTRKAREVIIGGDNDTPDLLAQACATADVLVHESTYLAETAEKIGFDPGHSSAERVARFAEQCRLPNLVLTHFSPRYGSADDQSPSIKDIESEARRFYHGNLFLANDFDTLVLDREGRLRLLA